VLMGSNQSAVDYHILRVAQLFPVMG
jgi:hypothetical protein